jgi:hypothetical protein
MIGQTDQANHQYDASDRTAARVPDADEQNALYILWVHRANSSPQAAWRMNAATKGYAYSAPITGTST